MDYKQVLRLTRLSMFDSREMFDLEVAFMNAGEANYNEGAIKHRFVRVPHA